MKSERSALLLVDIQNDFCPGGALAVEEGDKVCDAVNHVIPIFDFVVATQDWHPAGHCSFREQGGEWPSHCIQHTRGAELHPTLDPEDIDQVVKKGEQIDKDAYSAFQARDDGGLTLAEILRDHRVKTVFVAGLATEICVRATVLDALQAGFEVYVFTDAVRAVNPQRGEAALEEMRSKGAELIVTTDLIE